MPLGLISQILKLLSIYLDGYVEGLTMLEVQGVSLARGHKLLSIKFVLLRQ